jgi:hypothetical protein
MLMNRVLLGALAGLAATGPMTLAMKLMHEQLPREERYPLPPRQVTEGLAEKAGVGGHLDEEEREAATWASHFAYGAACGALYGAVSGERLDEHPLLAGVGGSTGRGRLTLRSACTRTSSRRCGWTRCRGRTRSRRGA